MLRCIKFQPLIIFGNDKSNKQPYKINEFFSQRKDAFDRAKYEIKTLKEDNKDVKFIARTIKFK